MAGSCSATNSNRPIWAPRAENPGNSIVVLQLNGFDPETQSWSSGSSIVILQALATGAAHIDLSSGEAVVASALMGFEPRRTHFPKDHWVTTEEAWILAPNGANLHLYTYRS